MERVEVGRFSAISFDGRTYDFIVYDNDTIDCPVLGLIGYNRIHLKPRFRMYKNNNFYTLDVECNPKFQSSKGLICNYQIDERLFAFLKRKKLIIYSTEMAHLYGFEDKDGFDQDYDSRYRIGNPFKRVRKKDPDYVLFNQKHSRFN